MDEDGDAYPGQSAGEFKRMMHVDNVVLYEETIDEGTIRVGKRRFVPYL